MDLFSTLSEAVDAAREHYLADAAGTEDDPVIGQFCLQKYVMQDGDIMWQAAFSGDESDDNSECLPLLYDDAAQAVWSGDFDPQELELEWQDENTLHEWDEGEFQLTPPTDTEEGEAAAEEWIDDDSESERW